MHNFKDFLKKIIYPPIALVIVFTALGTTGIITSVLIHGWHHIASFCSYAVCAYALVLICARIPQAVHFVIYLKNNNKYVVRWFDDPQLRVNFSLGIALIFNCTFALFQTALFILHTSVWYGVLAGYYFILAIMRFFILKDAKTAKRSYADELRRSRKTGIALVFLNLVLAGMMFYIVRLGFGINHNEIFIIAHAAYSFAAITVSAVNVSRYRKYERPIFTAAKSIDFTAALVSLITLETSMISTFGDGSESFRRTLTAITGTAVCIFVIVLAIYMIASSTHKLKNLRRKKNKNAK